MGYIEEVVDNYERKTFIDKVTEEIDKDTVVSRICNNKLLKIVSSKQRECIEELEAENEDLVQKIENSMDALVSLRVNRIRINTINKTSEDVRKLIEKRRNREAKSKIIKALKEMDDNKNS